MTEFGEELIKAMGEAVAHAEGKCTEYRVHNPIDHREVHKTVKPT
ncbi:MAG: hypothetical protein OXH65_10480 [Paracoccaceae bacterium]|nr:hypothetical protein [Paracoccaceae bacterium]MDE2675521.1 hypothetical protein [Paracoccaceae bacterium]